MNIEVGLLRLATVIHALGGVWFAFSGVLIPVSEGLDDGQLVVWLAVGGVGYAVGWAIAWVIREFARGK